MCGVPSRLAVRRSRYPQLGLRRKERALDGALGVVGAASGALAGLDGDVAGFVDLDGHDVHGAGGRDRRRGCRTSCRSTCGRGSGTSRQRHRRSRSCLSRGRHSRGAGTSRRVLTGLLRRRSRPSGLGGVQIGEQEVAIEELLGSASLGKVGDVAGGDGTAGAQDVAGVGRHLPVRIVSCEARDCGGRC